MIIQLILQSNQVRKLLPDPLCRPHIPCPTFLRHRNCRKNRGCLLMPFPVEMTCSKYHPRTMKMTHSTMNMPQQANIPLPESLRLSNCIPGVPRYTPRNEYCPISYSPRYRDQAGTHCERHACQSEMKCVVRKVPSNHPIRY